MNNKSIWNKNRTVGGVVVTLRQMCVYIHPHTLGGNNPNSRGEYKYSQKLFTFHLKWRILGV